MRNEGLEIRERCIKEAIGCGSAVQKWIGKH